MCCIISKHAVGGVRCLSDLLADGTLSRSATPNLKRVDMGFAVLQYVSAYLHGQWNVLRKQVLLWLELTLPPHKIPRTFCYQQKQYEVIFLHLNSNAPWLTSLLFACEAMKSSQRMYGAESGTEGKQFNQPG